MVENQTKNAVLGLSSSYNFDVLKPLVKTLKKTSFDGDIILFISSTPEETKKALIAEGVKLVEYIPEYPYFLDDQELVRKVPEELKGKFLSPNSLRYVLYQAYLEVHATYNWVLHTDTRDVIFQRDPFSYYTEPGLYCFLEDERCKIKDNKHNAYWINFGFGDSVFKEMMNENISCSGVTFGTLKSFKTYLDTMVAYILDLPNTGGLDQGIHNYLIFNNKIQDLHLVKDDEGPVTTLTTFKPYDKIMFNKTGELIDKSGQPFNIVHQYDRHLSLLWRFNKSAFFEKCVNLLKRRILITLGKKLD